MQQKSGLPESQLFIQRRITMNIILTPKLKQLVEQKVKNGSYKNADEVISAALTLLMEKDQVIGTWGTVTGTNINILGDAAGADIEALAFIVLMQAARDAQEDLKEIMNEVKAMNAAKRNLRELQKKVKCDIANSTSQAWLKYDANGMGSERAYHHVLMPVPDPCEESGVKFIETDLYKGRIANVSILESIRDELRDKLDSMSELGEMESMRLQMIMDRRSKLLETLSNIMKKISDTSQSITQNLK
jgi:Arc/MetJ-type ribon-helix-helix transcriptional regulator